MAAVAGGLPFVRMPQSSAFPAKTLVKPPKIRPGARVALLAPASPPAPEKIENALRNLSDMGFEVRPGDHLNARYGYLAGTDQERAADLMQAFTDPDIDVVWCVRGGYGCTRLLPLLDYKTIRKHPKPLIGFSDATALHLACYQEAGLVSFHGQVAGGDITPFTRQHLVGTLIAPETPHAIDPLPEVLVQSPAFQAFTLREGRAEGPLTGGNLALLAAMCGTPFAPIFKNHLVCIEEIGEAPYRVDRMLTQLLQGSDLDQAAGIVLGIFTDCEQKGGSPTLSLSETLRDRLAGLGIPVYYGAPFGHISNQCVLPMGVRAEMDAGKMQLRLLEAAVV